MSVILLIIVWLLCGVLSVLLAARWTVGWSFRAIGRHPLWVFAGIANLFAVWLSYGPEMPPLFTFDRLQRWLDAYGQRHRRDA